MTCTPDVVIPLAANAIAEAQATVCANDAGHTTTLITLVDTQVQSLHSAWLLCIAAQPALVTRTFLVTITLPMERPLNKVRASWRCSITAAESANDQPLCGHAHIHVSLE